MSAALLFLGDLYPYMLIDVLMEKVTITLL